MEFEWDEDKAEKNLERHGVSFNEAAMAFFDENAVELFDALHSDHEIRFQIVGFSRVRLLFAAFTERGENIRIISARKANKKQVRIYNEQNR